MQLWARMERDLSVPLELPRRQAPFLATKARAWGVIGEKVRNRRQRSAERGARVSGEHLGGAEPDLH